MKSYSFAALTFVLVMGGATVAQAQADSDKIENLAAVMSAEKTCGFKVNGQMLGMSKTALFGNAANVAPGGKYWPKIEENFARIRKLTATPSGKSSYCQSLKLNMSAFFD